MTDGQTLQVVRALERYGADLWFTRRHSLGEVLERLKALPGAQDKANDQVVFADYIKFIEFLEAECSGRGFSSDKQWGQLMNLMQISRKLNHKTVKFRDILANKPSIEASARDIKQFNESIRLGTLVEELFKDLETGLQTSQLHLISCASMPGCDAVDVDTRVLDEISKSQRHLETTLMPALHNLSLHLQNELVARDNSQKFQEWTLLLSRYTSLVDKLKQFLDKYHTFKKDIIQLRPLISGFVDKDDQQANATNRESRNSQLLANSLSKCKRNFKIVSEYNDSLEQCMKDLARSSSKTSRPTIKTKSTKVANDQVFKLHHLLDRKTLALVSDMYDSKLSEILKTSKECRQTLDQVMSTLRLEFGRFYFVNDLELLKIISLDFRLVENCEQVPNQRLIIKLFNGSIERFILKVDEKVGQTYIIGARSPAGEDIMLTIEQDPVPLRKKVNIYSLEIVRILSEFIRKLQKSLRTILMKSLENKEDIDWSLPIQLLSLAEQIKFTKNVESTFDIQKLITHYERQLRLLSDSKQSRTEQSHVDILKFSEVISLTVQFISILVELSHRKVSSITDWNWQKLARYYRFRAKDGSEEIMICLANSQFMYKFDLLPIELSSSSAGHEVNIKRLIYTKTSERCFLVASQAIGRLKLGASPFGPAGSGKTETVKALGQMLGCQVIVHNCDEANDARSLERLIWGLAHTGLWGCFDEFNRLSADTLSSVSAILEIVQGSLRQNRSTLELEGGQIRSIDQDSAFFITMNPGDSNRYQGRRRLPANLRSLFLPIAMINVQIDSIVCEMFLSHSASTHNSCNLPALIDAQSAAELGRKLSQWTVWMRSNLPTSRCEWDLRLVMVILKRFKMIPVDYENVKTLDRIVVKSIVEEVIHRLSFARGEIDILFRGLKEIFDHELANDFETEPSPETLRQQLESQLEVRPGVILLDSRRSGHSHRLWRSLVSRNEHLKWFALNPKSCDREALFGRFKDVQDATHLGQIQPTKWIDGLFTHLVRKSLKLLEDDQVHQVWIVLDGSLDTDWIESLNSVLDDNQVLTLSSGERLNFVLPNSRKCIKLIFLADNIEHVSPATISRLGLINLECGPFVQDGEQHEDETAHTITMAIVDHEQVKTADLICAKKSFPAGQFDSITYNCSELSGSNHLFDVLESTRLLRGENKLISINNLNSISSKNKWQTRTFVELLKFAVTYGFYYDSEHNIRHLPGNIRFVLTVTGGDNELTDERLSSLVSETVDLRNGSVLAETPIDMDALFSLVISAQQVGIALVHVDDDRVQSTFEKIQCFTSSDVAIELFTFNSSTSVARSLEILHKLAGQPQAKIISTNHKRCVFALNSLQLSLMDDKCRADLCHLLNLIKFAQTDIKFFMLFGRHKATKELSTDHKYWLSMADKILRMDSPKYDESYLSEYLVDVQPYDGRLSGLLASFSGKYTITDALLSMLKRMIATTRGYIGGQKEMLTNSLNRLEQFEKNIKVHRITITKEEQGLAEMKAQIEMRCKHMNKELAESKKRSEQIESLKQSQEQKTRELERNKVNIQKELCDVLPAIEESKLEVSRCLKPEALSEIKTLRSPPKTVEDILFVLFVFLGQDTTSWSAMKTYLAKQVLREEMTNYDFQARLGEDLLQRVEREISARNESFQLARASRASNAIVPILNWIQAARRYGQVLIKLKPLSEGIRKLEAESASLAKAMQELKEEQVDLDSKYAEDKKQLDRLNANFKSTNEASSRLRDDLDKALIVMGNLSHQLERWRGKLLEYDKLSCNNWQKLNELCLVCSSIACYARDHDSLDQLLRDWSRILGQDDEQLRNPRWFLQNQLKAIIECVDEDSALELQLSKPNRNGASESKSNALNQLVKVLLIKLNLHFNQEMIPYLKVDAALTSDELAQFLSFGRILCANQNHLVRIDIASSSDWQRKSDSMMQMSDTLLLLSTASYSGVPYLDIIKYILSRDSSRLPRKVILVDQSGQSSSLETSPLTRVLEIKSDVVTAASDPQMIEAKIIDYLIEFCEPTICLDIANLEAQLGLKQRQVRKLESNLIRSLMVSSGGPVQATTFQSELVHILSQLRQSGLELSASIDEITSRLDDLRSRRGRFETSAKQTAGFYARHLSGLRQLDPFYHVSVKKYARMVLNSMKESGACGDIDWSHIMTTVMCSMRSHHRNAFCEQIAADKSSSSMHSAAMSALKQAANLRSTLNVLTRSSASDDDDEKAAACKIAIIVHDATKSGPQLEIDELMRNQTNGAQTNQNWDYQVLCATKDGSLLQAQLDAVLSRRRNDANWRQCVCIANAHLASKWLSDRLLDLLANSECAGRLLIILISESPVLQSAGGGSRAPHVDIDGETLFSSNLLDAADLRFRYDELALKLVDRFTLYEHRVMAKQKDVTLRDITRELVLFHVVCQELTKDSIDSNGGDDSSSGARTVGWQHGDKYNFDYGQLSLAHTMLHQIHADNLATARNLNSANLVDVRESLCHYLSSIVYGSRLEKQADEELLERLLDKFLRKHDVASCQIATLDKLLLGLAEVESEQLVANLIGLSNQ